MISLVEVLREDAVFIDGGEWDVPIMLPDHLRAAANRIEQLEKRVAELEDKVGLLDEFPLVNQVESWVRVEDGLPPLHKEDVGFCVPASSVVAFRTEHGTVHLGYVIQESFGGSTSGEQYEPFEVYRWYDQKGDRIEDVTEWMDLRK